MASSPNFTLPVDDAFLVEGWISFSVCISIIILRYIVRFRTVGIRRFEGDDFIAIIGLGCFITNGTVVQYVYNFGSNVIVTPAIVDKLTDSEIAALSGGSKRELAAWYTYTTLIWTMKFMLLFFYRRLTMGTFQGKLIKYLFWICGLTLIAMYIVITFGCYPFEQNWQVRPLPPRKCTFRPQILLAVVILNVFTDALMLSVPIPMLWKLKIPIMKKLFIGAMLSSGVFVISAAIVRAVLSLRMQSSSMNANRWAIREIFVVIVSVNIPVIRPIFSRSFWARGRYSPHGSTQKQSAWSSRRTGQSDGTFELQSVAKGEDSRVDVTGDHASVGSQEDIIQKERYGP